MSTIKIYDWDLWCELCRDYEIDPYEFADFSIGVPSYKQITGGDTIGYEYVGDVPEKEE